MKKISYFAFVFVFVFALTALSGCFGRVPDLEDRISENTDGKYEYTGMIEVLEIDAYQQGTHQIQTDDDKLVIIQSRNFDLNRYLNKRVIIGGSYVRVIGNAEPVLNVEEIKFENSSDSGEILEYENSLYGLSFFYSASWDLKEAGNGLSLTKDDYKLVDIIIYNDKADMDSFVSSQESDEGMPVTIGAQRSLRFLNGPVIKMYIPNPPKKKVYKITFNEEGRIIDEEKGKFYDLLESIQLIYISTKKGDKCGGSENIKCEEDYRCELDSAEENAEGICVSLNPENNELNCPFIPVPVNCGNYRVVEYSKTTGCPTRYECIDGGSDLREETSKKVFDVKDLTETIIKYQDQILDTKEAEIIQFELTESENLIAVIYVLKEKKYKNLYSFSPSANEFNFIEKAHFEEWDNGNWRLLSGEDTQKNYSKIIIDAENGENDEDHDLREVSKDMSLYENQHRNFSLEYPKNWYYRSFGAINNTIWTVGFSGKSLDFFSDSVVVVSILEDKPSSSDYEYFTIRNRDDKTVFVVEGPKDLEETIDKIADSIQ